MLTLLALLCTAQAAPIGVVPLQGVLTDATGTPVEGDVDVLFQLYTDDTGSQSIYSEIVTLATVNGRFAYDLGSTQLNLDLAAFAQFQTIHLGVTVGTDTEMPLVPLSHVPYAAWAEDAAKLGGKTAQETSDDILIETDLRYRALGTLVPWSELTDIPADIADGDADTTYSGADFATSNQGCTPGSVVTGISATGTVICAADAGLTTEAELTSLLDDNYVYTAGTGIDINGNQVAVNQSTVEGWASAVTSTAISAHAADASAHHTRYADAEVLSAITAAGAIDLGAGANDDLTAADLTTLTGGGDASALHTHAAQKNPWFACGLLSTVSGLTIPNYPPEEYMYGFKYNTQVIHEAVISTWNRGTRVLNKYPYLVNTDNPSVSGGWGGTMFYTNTDAADDDVPGSCPAGTWRHRYWKLNTGADGAWTDSNMVQPFRSNGCLDRTLYCRELR